MQMHGGGRKDEHIQETKTIVADTQRAAGSGQRARRRGRLGTDHIQPCGPCKEFAFG